MVLLEQLPPKPGPAARKRLPIGSLADRPFPLAHDRLHRGAFKGAPGGVGRASLEFDRGDRCMGRQNKSLSVIAGSLPVRAHVTLCTSTGFIVSLPFHTEVGKESVRPGSAPGCHQLPLDLARA